MLDKYARKLIDPPLTRAAQMLKKSGLSATQVTVAGFGIGGLCCLALFYQLYGLALAFLLLNRLSDGLDGTLARLYDTDATQPDKGTSDYGGYLDIVLDMVFYAGFVFFFCLGRPEFFAYGAFLIFSFMGSSASFLTYGIFTAKHGEITAERGPKSFFHAAGVMEGTETILFFVLFCVFPGLFAVLSIIFAGLCWVTTCGRIYKARQNFSGTS